MTERCVPSSEGGSCLSWSIASAALMLMEIKGRVTRAWGQRLPGALEEHRAGQQYLDWGLDFPRSDPRGGRGDSQGTAAREKRLCSPRCPISETLI